MVLKNKKCNDSNNLNKLLDRILIASGNEIVNVAYVYNNVSQKPNIWNIPRLKYIFRILSFCILDVARIINIIKV